MHVYTHSSGHKIPSVIIMSKRKIKENHCQTLDKIKII